MRAGANDFSNFMRVDDADNEFDVVFIDQVSKKEELLLVPKEEKKIVFTSSDHIELLDEMIRRIEALPEVAMYQTVNQYDYLSLMIWLRAFSARIVADQSGQTVPPPS